MDITESNVGTLEMQLQQLGAKLDELVAKADEAGTEVRVDYRRRIYDLKSKHQVARSRLEELKTAGGEKWEFIKVGVEIAW